VRVTRRVELADKQRVGVEHREATLELLLPGQAEKTRGSRRVNVAATSAGAVAAAPHLVALAVRALELGQPVAEERAHVRGRQLRLGRDVQRLQGRGNTERRRAAYRARQHPLSM